MRDPLAVLAAVLALSGTAAGVRGGGAPVPRPPHIDEPPAAHTGGFGEPTCLECHLGAPLNLPGGRLTIQGLPEAYVPGDRYAVRIVLQSEEMGAAGFQFTARFWSGPRAGHSAGTLAPTDPRVAVTPGPDSVAYAHQTAAGSKTDDPDLVSWTVGWRAPESGRVAFHVAANSANGDNSPLSDLVYAASWVVAAESR